MTDPDALVATASRLRFATARLHRVLGQQDGDGLGPTAGAALATIGREGSPTLGELAALEQVAAPTMTKVVARLESLGLLRRQVDPDDRRVARVTLTDAGRHQLEERRSRRTAWLVRRLEELPAEDRQRLEAALDVLEQLAAPALR